MARLGLSPDHSGALVALVAGSRRYRHDGKRDSLLAAAREAVIVTSALPYLQLICDAAHFM